MSAKFDHIKALTFDVFGTVTDWRSSVIREGQLMDNEISVQVDWETFADEWRAGYQPAMQLVRDGTVSWRNIDDIHRT